MFKIKKKKQVFLGLMALLCFISFSTSASAATFGPYAVISYKKNEYDGVMVHLGSGVNKIQVDVKQWGIHANEKADIYWSVSYSGSSERKTYRVNGDVISKAKTLTFDNLKVKGGSYNLSWLSNTNNDMRGSYKVRISSGQVMK